MNIKINRLLKNYFSWMRNDFIFIFILIITVSFCIKLFHLGEAIALIAWIIIGIKCIKFMNAYSLIPSLINFGGGDHFSWKFLQSLPLSKKELILSLNLSSLLVSLPFLLTLLLGSKDLSHLNHYDIFDLLKFSLNYLLVIYALNLTSIVSLVIYPRIEYQNKINRHQLLQFFRYVLIILSIVIYSVIVAGYIYTNYDIDLMHYLNKIIKFSGYILVSWWLPVIATLYIIYKFHDTQKLWINEKRSYKSSLTSAKKEWSLIIILVLIVICPIALNDFSTPFFYRDNLLNKATYQKNYKKIDELLKQGHDLQLRNSDGFNPMFVAIHEGDLKTIKFLEGRGANFEGNLSKKVKGHSNFNALLVAIDSKNIETLNYLISKGFEINKKDPNMNFYPIHLAAFRCNSKLLDKLIEQGADINLLNDTGETPAMVAVREKCFSAAVTLRDAGANFNTKDKNGKKAIDYFLDKDSNLEFKYFIEKHSRLPASRP